MPHRFKLALYCLAVLALLGGAADAAPPRTRFVTVLNGAQERPNSNNSPATGTGTFFLNAERTELSYTIVYSGLIGGPVTGAHFHNAPATTAGPIVRGVDSSAATSPAGRLTGVWRSTDSEPLTPALVQELLAGRIYFNIHTSDGNLPDFPGGEIRGQLLIPAPTTLTFVRTPEGPTAADEEVCYTATVRDQLGAPVANAPVTFRVVGDTGSNTEPNVVVRTSVSGEAEFCFTPRFTGTNIVTITSPGLTPRVESLTTGAPQSTAGGTVNGSGLVDAVGGDGVPVPGLFSISARTRANGRVQGGVTFTVPGALRLRSIRLSALVIRSLPTGGRSATLFGTAQVNGLGRVPFRVDALDLTIGPPGDRFTISLLGPNAQGVPTEETLGGELLEAGPRRNKLENDVRIRRGIGAP
ncbi:MAG TPA: CHRD domain-containing protein [Armatimonadota bacterium]|nr:CHRD domain-containing protein [Armatimonadota bacterium]